MSKIKVGTQIEEEVYQQLKLAATRERRPVGEVIQDAVTGYLRGQRKSGLSRLLSREPLKLSEAQFRESMETDYYDQ
jgi:predicted CopG family antitoxin